MFALHVSNGTTVLGCAKDGFMHSTGTKTWSLDQQLGLDIANKAVTCCGTHIQLSFVPK